MRGDHVEVIFAHAKTDKLKEGGLVLTTISHTTTQNGAEKSIEH